MLLSLRELIGSCFIQSTAHTPSCTMAAFLKEKSDKTYPLIFGEYHKEMSLIVDLMCAIAWKLPAHLYVC